MLISDTDATLCAVAVLSFLLYSRFRKRRPGPLPPGPRGLPLIGNVFDMPATKSWETFAKWGQKYGPICSVTVLGQPIVIINKLNTAIDLLERRSAIFSERPRLVMGGELVGYNQTTPLLPYGPVHKTSRSHFSKLIGSNDALRKFTTIQDEESHRFLKRLLEYPDDLDRAVRQTAGALILRITYGIRVIDPVDPYVTLIDKATSQFSELISPGAFMVDIFPLLKYIPEWTGVSFQKKARHYRESFNDMLDKPFEYTHNQVLAGTAAPSFTSAILNESGKLSEKEVQELKCTASSLYAGAADTTVGVILAFFLAMCKFPEVQTVAQEEIDRVIGNDRLPTLADRNDLPYVKALAKEAFRYHTVGPTGVPHCVKEDNEFQGFFIPAGTIVFANLWQMAYDPEHYPNPEVFDPTRHLNLPGKPAQPDPAPFTFGFGRRACPGKFLAEQSVFVELAMVLATFNISPKKIPGGSPRLHHEWLPGAISHPAHFDYELVPRSEKTRSLILADVE
ncbi:cytochrome P450 [Flagelloscypha sp. PMI_526]|nr:cytochrome P450 [Flagelloscypha sp. PMI_526]